MLLEEIKTDIERLIARYEAEHRKVEVLQEELGRSRSEAETLRKQIAELTREVDTMKLAEAFSTAGATPQEARERLDRIIKEIDRCIAFLTKEEI